MKILDSPEFNLITQRNDKNILYKLVQISPDNIIGYDI